MAHLFHSALTTMACCYGADTPTAVAMVLIHLELAAIVLRSITCCDVDTCFEGAHVHMAC